ncbi:hypothetical protein [Planomicrobium okeanokoites]|uniref:Uncharacterized protein n=1 Tax=Planomicrobium okeanokoites TaxID=244 RepID=A0ABV7KN00_PLAOK|nr:hypothetical protein [Planomicrobium okeanokoites]TAA66812.1 hypothetical protein D2910_14280 [Planomicrobium okeanokoites]
MHMQNKRAKSGPKKAIQKYMFPITIISSIFISGVVGYGASQLAISNNASESAEINAMEKEVIEARNESIKVIETELPKIISDLDEYNQDINLIDENIKWLKASLAPIRESTGAFKTVITIVGGVNTLTNIPLVNKYGTKIELAKIKLDEVNNILVRLENLAVIQQEISDSNQKLKSLFEEYEKERNMEQLLLIEEELNSNLVYQIDDLRTLTIEAYEVVELSSSIITTVNQAEAILNFVQETGKNTLDAVQFWKDNDDVSEIEARIKEETEKDLAASKEKLKNLPDELAKQSQDTITSINNVQKELQTIKLAQMIISE